MPATSSRLRIQRAAAQPHALACIEQRLYTLHHEIRLIADVAIAANSDTGAVSLETLGVALSGYADRLQQVHDDLERLGTSAGKKEDL